jgi:hypothetical protein
VIRTELSAIAMEAILTRDSIIDRSNFPKH